MPGDLFIYLFTSKTAKKPPVVLSLEGNSGGAKKEKKNSFSHQLKDYRLY